MGIYLNAVVSVYQEHDFIIRRSWVHTKNLRFLPFLKCLVLSRKRLMIPFNLQDMEGDEQNHFDINKMEITIRLYWTVIMIFYWNKGPVIIVLCFMFRWHGRELSVRKNKMEETDKNYSHAKAVNICLKPINRQNKSLLNETE